MSNRVFHAESFKTSTIMLNKKFDIENQGKKLCIDTKICKFCALTRKLGFLKQKLCKSSKICKFCVFARNSHVFIKICIFSCQYTKLPWFSICEFCPGMMVLVQEVLSWKHDFKRKNMKFVDFSRKTRFFKYFTKSPKISVSRPSVIPLLTDCLKKWDFMCKTIKKILFEFFEIS